MKKVIALTLAIMLTVLLASAALAEEAQGTEMYVYTKNGKVLLVRSSMSSADNSNVIGSLAYGAKVIIYGVRDGWAMIDYGNTTGYVKSRFLVKKKPAPFNSSDSAGKNSSDTAGGVSTEEAAQPEAGKKFENDWAIPGGLVQIYYEEEGYRVIMEIDKEGAGSLREYACYYHEDTDNLVSVSSSRTDYSFDPETGEKIYGDNVYEGFDGENQATEFSIDADGCLVWKDGREDAGAGLKFANIGRFDGVWRNETEEVVAEFMWNGYSEDEMFYTVYITRGKTDGDLYTIFVMNGTYDPASGKLSAYGTCTLITRNGSGEYEYSEDDETYDAFFSRMEDGRLLFETANGIELEYDIMGHQS